MTNEAHEKRIQDCYDRWLEGEAKWAELVALIAQRSPEKIAAMERAKGLV